MNAIEPIGLAMKAKEKITKAYNVPSRLRSKGENTAGNTRTEAMPYTKKSKNSDARPMMTPMAISPGAILE